MGASEDLGLWSALTGMCSLRRVCCVSCVTKGLILPVEFQREMFGRPLVEACPVDPETGKLLPVATIVTDNGGPFRSFCIESFITANPELVHVRTRVKTPGQNGSRERGFGTLKYERLYLDEIDDALALAERAEAYRIEYNELRPHEAISWNRPKEVHLGLATPDTPTFKTKETLPNT